MNNLNKIHQGFNEIIASGRSLVVVQTPEEDRLLKNLMTVCEAHNKALWTWQANTGLTDPDGRLQDGTKAAETALDALLELSDAPMVWMKDLHHHYSATVIRSLRDLYYRWRERGGVVVISAPERAVPVELERESVFLRMDLPSQAEIAQEVEQWKQRHGVDLNLETNLISATLKGLTLSEVIHGLNRLKAEKAGRDAALASLQEEKRRLLSKVGTLEYIPNVPAIDDLGGLEHLKEWLLKRRALLTSDNSQDREIVPKGALLMGVSGCGKSLCVKAISSAWQLPLYRLEMVRIFSGAYGSPETAFADACHLISEMAPAVLWIDEIEMGLSADGSSATDPTLSRIFAFFLTWMQEKPPGLFVAATANRIDLLPAEMIRKGRFDQVFFVDLPHEREREAIFKIHLAKRGYEPSAFTPEVFADATEGWSGAEIEQCVVSAVTSARMESRDLNLKDLYAARKTIVPLSQTMEDQVRHIRNWAYERAVRASADA